jgi:hypothetical protein
MRISGHSVELILIQDICACEAEKEETVKGVVEDTSVRLEGWLMAPSPGAFSRGGCRLWEEKITSLKEIGGEERGKWGLRQARSLSWRKDSKE